MKSKNMLLKLVNIARPLSPSGRGRVWGCCLLLLFSLRGFAGNDSLTHTLNSLLNGKETGAPFFIKTDNTEFNQAWFETANAGSPQIHDYKKMAKAAMQEAEGTGNFVEYLTPDDLNQLPVGMKKRLGNTEITLAISNATFTNRYAAITMFIRIRIPQQPREIFFGVEGLKMSHKGGFIGDARLVLLGDVAVPFNNGNAALVFKGGLDIQTGTQLAGKTYVSVDCRGFKELSLAGEVQLPRSLAVPVTSNGDTIPNVRVTGSFNIIGTNWNDIMGGLSFNHKFQLRHMKGFIFQLNTAILDFSDYRNDPNIVYPAGYREKYIAAGTENLWRGVYVKDISIQLPKEFKDKTTPGVRVGFGAHDLLIDNNGISGIFYVADILPFSKGRASGWKFSVDSVAITLEATQLRRAALAGSIALSIQKQNSRLGYTAAVSGDGSLLLNVTVKDTMQIPLWLATAELYENSYVQLLAQNGQFYPEAMLHGKMGIVKYKTSDSSKKTTEIKGLRFQALHIKTTAPHITAQYFGTDEAIKFGNFPLVLDSIALVRTTDNETGLGIRAKLALQENEFGGSIYMRLLGKYSEPDEAQEFSFSRLAVDDIQVNANIKGKLKLQGGIRFMEDDPVYGDGFAGWLDAQFDSTVFKGAHVNVKAIFGKTDFRYWMVDGAAAINIPAGIFKINGFGGGAWYRMKKEGFNLAASPTGMRYTPDATAGLGIKAAVMFSVGDEGVSKGEASFEISFNQGGGIRNMGLYGYAKIMGNIPGVNAITQRVAHIFNKIENKLKNVTPAFVEDLEKLKIFQPSVAAKDIFPDSSDVQIKGQGISGYAGIQYDFNNRVLHANMDMYVFAAGGMVKGMASENRAGWAVLHIEPGKWYLHMGSPTDRLGIKVGIGPVSVQTGAYFMVGHDIPAAPLPPPQVIQTLGGNYNDYNYKPNSPDLLTGKGLAFGMNVNVSTGDLKFLIFYANFNAGLGFDLMFKKYENVSCIGQSGPIGMDGWYVSGQAYACLNGDVGIRIKLAGIKKNISIVKFGAAALLQAKFPNPSWFSGEVGAYFSILNGLVKGSWRMKVTIGQQCEMVQENDYDDYKTIGDITPADSAQNISVLAGQNVAFNMPVDTEILENGLGSPRYRVRVDYCKLVNGALETPVEKEWKNGNKNLLLLPKQRLHPQTTYTVKVKLFYEEWKNSVWNTVYKDGSRMEEVKEVSFKTASNPDTLNADNFKYSWPLRGQRNFYKQESFLGFIKLNYHQPYLFKEFNTWNAEFTDLQTGTVLRSPVSYDSVNTEIRFPVPPQLSGGHTCRFEIRGSNTSDSMAAVIPPYYENFNAETMQQTEATVLEQERQRLLDGKYESELKALLEAKGMDAETTQRFLFEFSELDKIQYLQNNGYQDGFIQQVANLRMQLYRQYWQGQMKPDGSAYTEEEINGYLDNYRNQVQVYQTQSYTVTNSTQQKPIVSYLFRVSTYNTFGQKIQALQVTQPIVGRIASDVIDLQAKVGGYEGFELAELQGSPETAYQPLVTFSAGLTDAHYSQDIYPLIYPLTPTYAGLQGPGGINFPITSRSVPVLGAPPAKAIRILPYYLNCLAGDPGNSFLNQRFPFVYALSEIYNGDFHDLRTKVVNHYVQTANGVIPAQFNALVNQPFPFMRPGGYPVQFRYRLPGDGPGVVRSQGTFTFTNPID